MKPENHYVSWPDTEPIPQSMEEALALEWTVVGYGGGEMSDDERVQTGNMELVKDAGMLRLLLEIPFRAEFSYGKPYTPRAVIPVPNEAVPS
jgi:hypothetical protein